tara:strand:+ start:1406 stop:1999 length:594 start_codon:yes stop_codon:yes gene_type:complete
VNWYKKLAQLERTLPYFQEFEDEGEYVPDPIQVHEVIQDRLDTSIVSDIGSGASGVAYELANGDVLKITTNPQEAKIAEWMIKNPHPSVVEYRDVWKEGDLHYIVMEKIDKTLSDFPWVAERLKKIIRNLDFNKCYNVKCAIDIIEQDEELQGKPIHSIILDYLSHLANIPNVKIFDFLSPENIGIKGDKLKFFDVT